MTMNRAEKLALKENHHKLYDSFEPKDVMDHVIQFDVLDESERAYVLHEVTRNGRNVKFFGYLKKKQNGFGKLINILQKVEMNWLYEPLLESRDRLIANGENYCVIDKCRPEKIKKKLTEKQCMEIGKCLGPNWKDLAISLDLASQVYPIEVENRDSPHMCGFSVLLKWGQMEVDNANLSRLLPILDEMGVEYDEQKIIKAFS